MLNLNKISVDVFKTDERVSNELFIYECGYEHCKPHKPYEYNEIDYYLIHYILDGEGTYITNNTTYKLKAGDGFLICPNSENIYYPNSKNPWSYRWVGFNGTKAKNLLMSSGFTTIKHTFNYSKDNFVNECLEKLFLESNKGNLFSGIGYLYLLLGKLIEQHNIIYKPALNASEQYIAKVIEYIRKNYNKDITIEEMSLMLNLSRSQLFKIFKKLLNMSPQQYLLNYRLNKASELLRKSSYSVSEISYLVGFNSPAYFSKVFTKYKNKSPLEYRKLFIKTLIIEA